MPAGYPPIKFSITFEAKDCPYKGKKKRYTPRFEGIDYYRCRHHDSNDGMCNLAFNEFEYPDFACPLIANKNQISGPWTVHETVKIADELVIPPVEIRQVRKCTGEFPCVYCDPDIHAEKFNCTNKYTKEWDVTNGRLYGENCIEHITNDEVHDIIVWDMMMRKKDDL